MDQVQSVGQMLLQEIKELRNELSEWRQDTGERLAKLETDVKHGVSGNGQPSRLAVVEDRLRMLERAKWWVIGAAAAIGAVSELLLRVVR